MRAMQSYQLAVQTGRRGRPQPTQQPIPLQQSASPLAPHLQHQPLLQVRSGHVVQRVGEAGAQAQRRLCK